MASKWSRTEVIALLSLLIAFVSCLSALAVVPEVRAFLKRIVQHSQEPD